MKEAVSTALPLPPLLLNPDDMLDRTTSTPNHTYDIKA